MGYQETIIKPINNQDFDKLLNRVVKDQKKWYTEGIKAYSILEIKKKLPNFFNVRDKAIVVGGERYFQKRLENYYKNIGIQVFFIEYFSDIGYLEDENYTESPIPYKYSDRDFTIEFFKKDFDNVVKKFKSEADLEEYITGFSFIYGSIFSYLSNYHYDTLRSNSEEPSSSEIHKKIDITNQQVTIYTTKKDTHDFRTSKDLTISWKLVEKTDDNLTYLFTYKDENLES